MKRVYHDTYKEGTVSSETSTEYVVIFDSVGEKKVPKNSCVDILHD